MICHAIFKKCNLAFFLSAEQMVLLWLDTDGVSVVIPNIPPSVGP